MGRSVTILNSMQESVGWSESSLGPHGQSYVSDIAAHLMSEQLFRQQGNIQSNLNGSNIFRTIEIRSKHG